MNIAEILKYCPKGTKLYSLIDGETTLENVNINSRYPIETITSKFRTDFINNYYTKDGLFLAEYNNGECLLFPSKEQRDWQKFRLPVERGDIMMNIDGKFPFIATGEMHKDISPKYICGINSLGYFQKGSNEGDWITDFYIPASEEVKKELFDKMAEAGYKWNADTLELEKIESQFKKGDVVVDKNGNVCLVSKVEDSITIIVTAVLYTDNTLKIYNNSIYRLNKETTLASIKGRNKFYSALVREGYKYDKQQHKLIKQEFKPFDKVLVKDDSKDPWKTDIYLSYTENTHYHYRCTTGHYGICIPYEGNEYLVEKTVNNTLK